MHTNKLLAVLVLGLGLTLALLWSLDGSLAVAAPQANLIVTKFTDSADGACDSDCSLREAIIAANGNGQDNTIELGSGIYTLSLTTGSSEPAYDDLNVKSSYALTITGNGPQNTFINANGIDRVFFINAGVPTVVISGVTIYGGATPSGGGGIDHLGGDLILINTAVVSNTSTAYSGGGGIALTGSDAVLTLDEDCLVAGNEAFYYGGGLSVSRGARALLGGGRIVSNTAVLGGGLYAYQGNVTLSGVQIVSNTASLRGGGVFLQDSTATLNGGAILSNTAGADGGGLYVGGVFTQTGQSVIAHNTAYTRGGGIYAVVGTVVLNDGQIIRNQVSHVGDNWYGGGGVYVAGYAALIQTGGNTIIENSAAMNGGGVHIDGGRATLSGGQILSNTAGKNGGGVYLYNHSDFTQAAGLIAYNEAQGTDTSDGGGGLYSNAPSNSVWLNGGQIMENQANRGGGLYVRGGSLDLLGAEIVGNQATQYGGGVYAGTTGWITQIEGGRIISNSAAYGGGLYAIEGSVTLERGQIVDNRASVQGGGVYHDTGGSSYHVLTLVNTTISGNTASDDGSALVNASGTTVLTYTTIASNTIDPPGYGIQKGTGSILANNTIIAYNGDKNCAESAVTSNNHNLDSDGSCEFAESKDQSEVDPELAPLAYDLGTLVHAITPDSPAYDAGACQAGIPTDQRGVHRLAPCDVGAYEYGEIYTLTMATDGTGAGAVDPPVGTHFYILDAVVPITASAGSHSTFQGWSGDLDGSDNPTSITIDGDKTVTATFDLLTYTLTVATDTPDTGSGTVDPPVGAHVYDYGSTVWLTAAPDASSTFLGWEGAALGLANPVSVTVTSDATITATFTAQQVHTLTVATDGTGVGTVNPSVGQHGYISGTTVWLTATKGPNSTFVGWSGDLDGATNPTSITMDGNKAVTATFDLIPDVYYTLTVATDGTGVGTVDPSVGAHSYLSGTVVPITAIEGQNSVFESWSGDLSGSTNPTSITMDENKAVTAIFSATGCIDLTDISIDGSASGAPGVYTFTTSFTPPSATPPIAYLWDNGDVTSTSVRSLELGTTTLMVTATNCTSALVTAQRSIVIMAYVYLPLVMQSQ